jgi:hypothetical protein
LNYEFCLSPIGRILKKEFSNFPSVAHDLSHGLQKEKVIGTFKYSIRNFPYQEQVTFN